MTDADERRLDGNAAGGLLSEIFSFETTTAVAKCAGCGAVNAVGALAVYASAMGTIIRCTSCENAVIRIGCGPAGYWLDMQGLRHLQIRTPA